MLNRPLLTTVLAALLLVGCGAKTPGTPKTTTAALSAERSIPLLKQQTAPGAAASAATTGGLALLQHVRQVLDQATGFQAEIMSNTEGHYQNGTYTPTLRHVAEGFRVIWGKPLRFRATVFDAPSALMEGATIVTTDGVNVTARAQGFLSIIPIHGKANDPRIANARNHTLDKFAPGAQMMRLTGPAAIWTIVRSTPGPSGQPIIDVQIDGVQHLDKEIDAETLTVDLGGNTLKSMIAYVKGHPVVTYTFNSFSWDPKTTSATFTI